MHCLSMIINLSLLESGANQSTIIVLIADFAFIWNTAFKEGKNLRQQLANIDTVKTIATGSHFWTSNMRFSVFFNLGIRLNILHCGK